MLEPGNSVMANRGFDIADLLPAGVQLITPSFMDGRAQLPKKEELSSRRIASARIQVERSI